jgi:hypothetical protein
MDVLYQLSYIGKLLCKRGSVFWRAEEKEARLLFQWPEQKGVAAFDQNAADASLAYIGLPRVSFFSLVFKAIFKYSSRTRGWRNW